MLRMQYIFEEPSYIYLYYFVQTAKCIIFAFQL